MICLSGKNDQEPEHKTAYKHQYRSNRRKVEVESCIFKEFYQKRKEQTRSNEDPPEPVHVRYSCHEMVADDKVHHGAMSVGRSGDASKDEETNDDQLYPDGIGVD